MKQIYYQERLQIILAFFIFFMPMANHSFGQIYHVDEGCLTQGFGDPCIGNPLIISAPFLRIPVDANAGGLGGAGIASIRSRNAMFFNASKISFYEASSGITANSAFRLGGQTGNNLRLASLSVFQKFGDANALGINFKRAVNSFNHSLPTSLTAFSGYDKASESLLSIAYSRKLGNHFSSALNLKYIYSNIAYAQDKAGSSLAIPGQSFAGDLSFTFNKKFNLNKRESTISAGLALTNIGFPMAYNNGLARMYLPANLGIGLGWSLALDDQNKLSIFTDANKLLVPLPDEACDDFLCNERLPYTVLKAAWRSFYDADGGFQEEWNEVYFSFGLEYDFEDRLFLRSGFYLEQRAIGGNRNLTFGAGYNYRSLKADISIGQPVAGELTHQKLVQMSISYSPVK
ncbi:PorV/PorQ family protein [Portibacter marinus]|uniref:PorV/PorQ family protein n=1 Tax=Portibacter marinus TaxID=2898660 RepID=UPI001F2E770B|nr:PorV/PorQ family protein [Portibacter marinus]